jgi:hypothetical protein
VKIINQDFSLLTPAGKENKDFAHNNREERYIVCRVGKNQFDRGFGECGSYIAA